MVLSSFPSCGRLTFPQHLEIAPHICCLLTFLHCSSISTAPWHSRCPKWETTSLLVVSHWFSAWCPQPSTGGMGQRERVYWHKSCGCEPWGSEHARAGGAQASAGSEVCPPRHCMCNRQCITSAIKRQHRSVPLGSLEWIQEAIFCHFWSKCMCNTDKGI